MEGSLNGELQVYTFEHVKWGCCLVRGTGAGAGDRAWLGRGLSHLDCGHTGTHVMGGKTDRLTY